MYQILEVHIVFDEKENLREVAVLWADNDYCRATYAKSNSVNSAYASLRPNDILHSDLIQEIAGEGAYLPEALKKKYFPKIKNWSR
jgi:predicted P-loop ATPase/GTPase